MKQVSSQNVFDLTTIQNSQTAVDLQLRYFKGEAYNDNEKQQYLSNMKLLAGILFLFSLPLSCIIIYYLSIIQTFFLGLFLFSGICMVLLGLAAYEWAKEVSLKIFKNQSSAQKESLASHRYSLIMFILSISLALFNFMILVYLYSWVENSYDTYIANKGISKFEEFKQSN